MKKTLNADAPKQIVYILGAGATQAEATHQGGVPINLMMKDSEKLGLGVSSRIKTRINLDRSLEIRNEVDIEKLISLLSASGINDYSDKAEQLRKGYFEEIIKSLDKAEVLNKPELAIGLLEMHNNKTFKKFESLSGIISLNHDNLFQLASQKVHNCINLGFEFRSEHFEFDNEEKSPLIIHLHGAFNWMNTLPIEILKLTTRSKYDKEILWIPPAILKESKDYPYNKLMGLAYEVLTKKCDILRVIGCSLSQNDWNLISLIFNAQYFQYHFNDKNCFRIELIMDHETGETIKKDYSYLKNLYSIGYLKDGSFSDYKNKVRRSSEMDNPFKYWLKIKVLYHLKRGEIDLADMGETLKGIIGER